jgi:hypothetical protein
MKVSILSSSHLRTGVIGCPYILLSRVLVKSIDSEISCDSIRASTISMSVSSASKASSFNDSTSWTTGVKNVYAVSTKS